MASSLVRGGQSLPLPTEANAYISRVQRLRQLLEPDDCPGSFADPEKPGGLLLTQATNVWTAGSSRMASIVENFFASWESVKIACI
jgi:hypothetical protein